MPFELKNVGATYQQLAMKIFEPILGTTTEFYIDDMLVKSLFWKNHPQNLEQAFALNVLDEVNPWKCVFGVNAERFLDLWSLEEELRWTR